MANKLQVLCVTMKQTDFLKYEKMNIHSEVIFSNQSDITKVTQASFGEYMKITDLKQIRREQHAGV